MSEYLIVVPAVLILLVGAAFYRWLTQLQGRVNDHAERIAWLEAKANGHHERRTEP